MNKKYIVRLTDEERAICEATIKKETGKSQKLRRATILLKADADGSGWGDAKISEAVGCRTRTVENVRQAFVLEGFEIFHGVIKSARFLRIALSVVHLDFIAAGPAVLLVNGVDEKSAVRIFPRHDVQADLEVLEFRGVDLSVAGENTTRE